jgi:hypothetical protein
MASDLALGSGREPQLINAVMLLAFFSRFWYRGSMGLPAYCNATAIWT